MRHPLRVGAGERDQARRTAQCLGIHRGAGGRAAAGATTPPPEYFGIIREICDRYGVPSIADEVITGLGRSGKNFGIEHWGVTPDILTAAKGLSVGYAPLGAVIAHDRVREAFAQAGGAFVHGYPKAANPLSVGAGVAVLDIIVLQAGKQNTDEGPLVSVKADFHRV